MVCRKINENSLMLDDKAYQIEVFQFNIFLCIQFS